MPLLTKPQIQPTVGPPPSIQNWHDIHRAFAAEHRFLATLVLYLQTYLAKVYNAVVPTQFNVVTVAATASPYTAAATDEFIAASASSAAATVIDLPAATGSGRTICVKKMDANAQNIAVTPNGSDKIDGASVYNLTAQYDVARLADIGAGVWAIW